MSSSRRRFLQLSTAALSGVILSNCTRNLADVNSSSEQNTTPSNGTASNELHIYSWSSYIDEDVLKDFETKTGIRVIADIYDSNETMLAKMQAGGGSAYGIIYPSDYMVEQMIELDLLTELDKSRLPGTESLLDQWKSPPYDPNNTYSYPVSWGTTGLIYNARELGEIEDWDYLWDNTEEVSHKMTFLNDVREVMGAALKALGYSNSSTNPAELEKAYQYLAELKPHINAFTTDAWRNQIIVGDLLVAHAYSVDGIDAMAENADLQYVVPSSGATVWTDTMVIPKTAPNLDAAYAWMNYMLDPASSAEVVNRLKFATPNQEAIALLDPEVKENPSLFPSDKVLAKCEVLKNVGDTIDLYDRYWTQLTSA